MFLDLYVILILWWSRGSITIFLQSIFKSILSKIIIPEPHNSNKNDDWPYNGVFLSTFESMEPPTALQKALTVRVQNIYSSSLRKMHKENNASVTIGTY